MTGLIPKPFIDELISRTDIVELIDSYIPLKPRGTNHLACCPFHNEKTPSFTVSEKKQFYHCFGCGVSGNAINFVMNYLNQSFSDAVETLAARLGLSVPREGTTEKHTQSLTLYQLLGNVAMFYQKTMQTMGQAGLNYLGQRGVSAKIIQLYQLGYAPAGWQTLETQFKKNKRELIASGMIIQKEDGKTYDRYRQRVLFPIHDRLGRIIGFGGRAISNEQKPKYLNSPETVIFQKSRELYGLHQILQQANHIANILIVEGYMDVIALAQHDILNAVATMGTATSTYHIQLLSKHSKQLFFCFDGDSAGKRAAWRALENSLTYLNTGLDVNFIFLPEGHDPDSLVREEGKEQFLQRLQYAVPLNRFLFDTLSQGIDITSLAGKSQLMNRVKPYLLKMAEGPYMQLIMDELSRLTRIDNHRINQLIHDQEVNNKAAISSQPTKQHITRSPIRLAIALLLQHPEIAIHCADKLHAVMLDGQGQEVLKTLLERVIKTPQVNTATLVEYWRDTPLFEPLNKLAVWNTQVPEQAMANELIDTILFLEKQNKENKIRHLIEKSHQNNLTATERALLQNMLKQRHEKNS